MGFKEVVNHKVKVAIIGCGAITENFHLPAALKSPNADLIALIDTNVKRANQLKNNYGLTCKATDSFSEALSSIDAAIIATPNNTHYQIASDLINKGIHILVEKPLTISSQEAANLCEIADRNKCIISVGFVTRHFPSTKLLKELLQKQYFGNINKFVYEFGSKGGWSSVSGYNLTKKYAGGGVLTISGSHFIDRMIYLFGEPTDIKYRDDNHGGVEANCEIDVTFSLNGESINGTAFFSKTYNLKNRLRIFCEKAELEIKEGQDQSITVFPIEKNCNYKYEMFYSDYNNNDPKNDYFAIQLEDFIDSIRTRRIPLVCGRQGLKSVKLIEKCYENAEKLEEPWMIKF